MKGLYKDTNGNFIYKDNDTTSDITDCHLVWPEPNEPEFRRKALLACREARKTMRYKWKVESFLNALLGKMSEEEMNSLQNSATPQAISEIISSAFSERYKDNHKEALDQKTDNENEYDIAASAIKTSLMGLKNHVLRLFSNDGYDNRDDCEKAVLNFFEVKQQEIDELLAKAEAQRQLLEQEEEERLRAEYPNFKKVSAEKVAEFKKVGIDKIFYNTSDITIPYKRSSTSYEAFSRLFLCCLGGKSNILYYAKEDLKMRFNAKYTKDFPDDKGTSYWHIPAETELDDLLELLKEYERS